MKTNILQQIIDYFNKEKIQVYGINSSNKMKDAPTGFHPDDYLPDSKSIICFALPVPKAVYSLNSYKKEFVWRSQNLIYRDLDTHSLKISNILENNNYKAVPIFGCLPQRYNSKKELAGYLNQIQMGNATKIGFIGKNGLLLNSLYGSRMMLGGVITNAVLPSTYKPHQKEKGCPKDCDICIKICPVNAILPNERKVQIMKCLYYTSRTPFLPKLRFFYLRLFKPEKSIRLLNFTSFDEHTFHICSLCVSECPYNSV
jgi:epoxyqueuosine reductase QueG